jgi:iron-sulfur cluster repair protein YtfE (RIC family)
MEYNETLQVLSRQHIEDRMKCRELMRDIQQHGDKRAIRQNLIQFWQNELRKHVDIEEQILFPFLQKHQFSYDFINVLKREHDTIRTLAERLPMHDDGYYLYKAFVKLVDQHSHFEDEILFRKMKEELPAQDLAQLNQSMQYR